MKEVLGFSCTGLFISIAMNEMGSDRVCDKCVNAVDSHLLALPCSLSSLIPRLFPCAVLTALSLPDLPAETKSAAPAQLRRSSLNPKP